MLINHQWGLVAFTWEQFPKKHSWYWYARWVWILLPHLPEANGFRLIFKKACLWHGIVTTLPRTALPGQMLPLSDVEFMPGSVLHYMVLLITRYYDDYDYTISNVLYMGVFSLFCQKPNVGYFKSGLEGFGRYPVLPWYLPVNTVLGKTGFGHPAWEKLGKTQLHF